MPRKPGTWRNVSLALFGVIVPAAGRAGDPVAGEAVFKNQCGICHSTQPGKTMVGPTLFGVVGRTSGSVEGFGYSAANKASNIVWTPDMLDRYLAAPREVVPGTIMAYPGLKVDAKRADVIAYLDTLR